MRILIVEDEKDLAEALARGLRRQGYAADIAYNGEEALVLAEVSELNILVPLLKQKDILLNAKRS